MSQDPSSLTLKDGPTVRLGDKIGLRIQDRVLEVEAAYMTEVCKGVLITCTNGIGVMVDDEAIGRKHFQ